MADDVSNSPGPFDVPTVKALVRLMRRHDLSEIDLREGNRRILLRRGGLPLTVPGIAPVTLAPLPTAATPTAAVPQPVSEAVAAKKLLEIKCPAVGTYYSKPNPDAAPFVTIGSRVTPTTVVCIIMAMKMQNEIQAECSGVITEILMKDEDAVDYGQVLFRVDPTG